MAEQVGSIYYDVEFNTSKMLSGAVQVERTVKDTAKSFDVLGASVSAVAAAVSALFAAGALANELLKASQVARTFEKSISELSAITGATGDDLVKLTEAAKLFGQTTNVSAVQAANAFKLLASAKPELLETAGALEQVTGEAIVLANAAGIELPAAADSLGLSLNQFGASADQAGRFINVLAAGAKFGASEIADTSLALKNAAVSAASAGVSFEEANAAIQALAAVGIKGGEAGTALRNVILKLENEANAKLKPSINGLAGALENLNAKSLSSTELTKLFGLENVNAATAILTQTKQLRQLTADVTGTNTAYEQAKINTDNYAGSVDRLSSSYEGLQIELGSKLNPILKQTAEVTTSALSSITEVIKGGAFEKFVIILESLAIVLAGKLTIAVLNFAKTQALATREMLLANTAATTTIDRFGIMTVTAGQATVATNALSFAMRGLNGALALVGGPAGLLLIVAAGIYAVYQNMQQAKQETLDYANQIDRLTGSYRNLNKVQASAELAKNAQFQRAITDEIKDQAGEVKNLERRLAIIRKFQADGNKTAILAEKERDASEALAISKAKLAEQQEKLNKSKALDVLLTQQSISGARAQTAPGGGRSKPELAVTAAPTAAAESPKKKKSQEQDRAVSLASVTDNQEEIDAAQEKVNRILDLNKTKDQLILDQEQASIEQINLLRAQDLINEQTYQDALLAIQQNATNQQIDLMLERQQTMDEAAEEAKQRELERQRMILSATADMFSNLAGLAEEFSGKQSSAFKVLFALSKGFAAANASLNLFTAISQALADPTAVTLPQKFANYAAIASAGGALISSIRGTTYSGARQYGGPVSADGMYKVGENGPEVFKAANGNNYMIPGRDGSVVSSDKIGGAAAANVIVNNYGNDQVTVRQMDDKTIIDIAAKKAVSEVAGQIATKTGSVASAMSSATNTTWKAA